MFIFCRINKIDLSCFLSIIYYFVKIVYGQLKIWNLNRIGIETHFRGQDHTRESTSDRKPVKYKFYWANNTFMGNKNRIYVCNKNNIISIGGYPAGLINKKEFVELC